MTCRTPTSAAVCTSSSQTGAKLTYDAEGRLIQWVSADGSTTVKYGYDGEGQRFEMQVITSSTTTTTTYLSNLEESTSVNGGSAAVTGYFSFNGQRLGEYQNSSGAWYYLLSDGLSSTTVVVNSTGVVAAQLFAPYGQVRWAGGTMPTSFAFTGQRADSATGLDYYVARYYDPAAGIFTSADTVLGKGAGLNRYAYVSGNPETLTDPTGHLFNKPCLDGEWCGGSPSGPGGTVGGGKCPDGIQSGCEDDGGDPNCFKGCDCPAASFCSPVPPPPSGVQPPARTCNGSQVYANLCSGGNDTGSLFQSFLGMNFSTLTAVGVYGMNALLYLLQELYDAISNTPFTPPVSVTQIEDWINGDEFLAGFYTGLLAGSVLGPEGSVAGGFIGGGIGLLVGLFADHTNEAQNIYDREVNELKQAKQNLLSAVSGAIGTVNDWIDWAKATQQWNLTLTLTSSVTIVADNPNSVLNWMAPGYIVGASFDIEMT